MKVTPPEGGSLPKLGATGLGGSRSVPDAADIPVAGGYFGAGDVEAALAALAAAVAALQGTTGTTYWPMLALTSGPVAPTGAHISDTTDAHDASAISFVPNGSIAATDVQAAIQEVRDEASGIPVTVVDVKGDLIAATAADTVARLPVGANGSSVIAASGETTGLKWRLNNDGAAVAPTVNEDSGDGYQIGSRWLDTTADKEYVALDVTVGAAVWVETTITSGSGSVATDAIWDAKGDLAGGTGANTAARLAAGTNGHVLTADSAETTGMKWAAPGGGSSLLAVMTYAPGTDTVVNATTTSTTFVDVDATNALITFTAPASGKVLVRLSALQSGSATPIYYWGLRESTSDIGTPIRIGNGSAAGLRQTGEAYLTGVSAGSHTYKWSHRVSAANACGIYGGPTWGPITMEVWAAP